MRLVHIAAGAGAMYCGACAHDAALIRGLLRRGHDVTVMPVYTPLKVDSEAPLPTTRIFIGGINAYLQQKSPLFRRAPAFLDRLFDGEGLLRWASTFAVKTNPADLGPMTVSVLQGQKGMQQKEISKLFEFIQEQPKPDLVSITNSLLSGLAPTLRERLGVPVACLLQGEDSFVEAIAEPYRRQAKDLMRRNAESIDLFLAPSEDHRAKMAEFLALSPDKLKVVRIGIETESLTTDRERARTSSRLGYLSVINPSKGLDLLVDAFIGMADDYPDLELHVVGRVLDKAYFRDQVRKLERVGLENRFIARGEFTYTEKIDFLQSCDLYCLPSRVAESRGIAVLEAMAAGLPVVVPEAGIFPEMLALTGGGLAFPKHNLESLSAALRKLLDDLPSAIAMGTRGAAGVREHFSADRMVQETEAEYLRLLSS